MSTRFALATVLSLTAFCTIASLARARSGSCCLPSGGCILAASAGDCTSITNRGVFIGSAACAQDLSQCYADVFVVDLPDAHSWGALAVGSKMIHGYSFGTYSCNQGTTNVLWQRDTPFHPVISQDLFRLSNGRFEHIGMAWMKHGNYAASGAFAGCGSCTWVTNGTSLGVGCADAYYASDHNGDQSLLGPRSIINPSTGVFLYNTSTWPPFDGSVISRRVQVDEADLNIAGATYWAQGQYITQDDAAAGKALNNASYRRVFIGGSPDYVSTMQDTVITKTPVIYAWQSNGLGLNIPDPGVLITPVDIAGDGRLYIASKASNNGNGTWHYEYAVQNFNSDRAGGAFIVPINRGVQITNVGFHAPLYHSGEVYDNTPWVPTVSATTVRWDPAPLPNPNPQNLQTNALRYATIYNFRFDATIGPAPSGQISMPLFKPGSPATISAAAAVPACAADFNSNGAVTVQDIFDFLAAWFPHAAAADFNHSGTVTAQDLFDFLAAWFAHCA